MSLKQTYRGPSPTKLAAKRCDLAIAHGMKTPQRNDLIPGAGRQRLPLTPVNNYAEAAIGTTKPRQEVFHEQSRLPGCGGSKQPIQNVPASENDHFYRDPNAKLKFPGSAAVDYRKPTTAARPPRIAGPPGSTVSAFRTAKRAEAQPKPVESTTQQRPGTRLFAAPAPGSVRRPALLASAKPAPVGAPLVRYGSVSRIPLPKGATASLNPACPAICPIGVGMSACRGSPADRAVSLLDMTAVQQDFEPIAPKTTFGDILFSQITETPTAVTLSRAAKLADTSISMPHGLQDEAVQVRDNIPAERTKGRVSVSMTNLGQWCPAEQKIALCDAGNDPMTPARVAKEQNHQIEAELATVKQTVAEDETKIRELERSAEEHRQMLAMLEEYNDNYSALVSEEQAKAKEAQSEATRCALELHALRADRARLESEVACERDATNEADAARQEAASLRRELATALANFELLSLESARVAAAKDELLAAEKKSVAALRCELEASRRGAADKYAELRAEVDGALAERNSVRFELEKLQIAHAACAGREAALAATARAQQIAATERSEARRSSDESQHTLVSLRSDVERLTKENATLNALVGDRIESIASEFDSVMRTIVSSNEDRERTLNASMMLNSSRFGGSRGTGAITYEKLERLVADQFAAQKMLAERDTVIGRLRDQLATAEFSKEKTVRELLSLEKLLIRIYRRLQHNVGSMNDECKQLIAELHTLLRGRGDREDASAKVNEAQT